MFQTSDSSHIFCRRYNGNDIGNEMKKSILKLKLRIPLKLMRQGFHFPVPAQQQERTCVSSTTTRYQVEEEEEERDHLLFALELNPSIFQKHNTSRGFDTQAYSLRGCTCFLPLTHACQVEPK